MELTRIKEILEIAADFFNIIGIIIGGLWVYFNFVRGRIYKPRIELALLAEIM
jgi:hypothetical protein